MPMTKRTLFAIVAVIALGACSSSPEAPGKDASTTDSGSADGSISSSDGSTTDQDGSTSDMDGSVSDMDGSTSEMDAGVVLGGLGSVCTTNTDCLAGPSPRCVDVPGGYCTSNCETNADCPDGLCVTGLSAGSGICVAGCTTAADCRDGYDCQVLGSGSGCVIGTSSNTDGGSDAGTDGGTTTTDAGFVASIGDGCGVDNDCGGSLMCLHLVDGYCTKSCTGDNSCLPAFCYPNLIDSNGLRNQACVKRCIGDGDCRGGYSCVQLDATQRGCVSSATINALDGGMMNDAGMTTADAGSMDAGSMDAGSTDAGPQGTDAGSMDAGSTDAGSHEMDAGSMDMDAGNSSDTDGGTSMPGTGVIGDACSMNNDCGAGPTPLCLGGPGGYCSSECATDVDCPHGRCLLIGTSTGCAKECTSNSECRFPDYSCQNLGGFKVCAPACQSNGECNSGMTCNPLTKQCE